MSSQTQETTPQSSQPSDQPGASTTSTNDDGLAALQSVVVPDIDAGETDADAAQEIGEDGAPIDLGAPDPEKMTKDAFWAAFKSSFKLGSVMFPGGALPELAVQPDEQDHARAASDASYDILDAYWPGFLSGDRDQLMLFLTAGSFFLMKAKIVQAAIMARRAVAVADPQSGAKPDFVSRRPPPPQPSNDPISTEWSTEVEDDE